MRQPQKLRHLNKYKQLPVSCHQLMTGNDAFQTVCSTAIMGKYENEDNIKNESNMKQQP